MISVVFSINRQQLSMSCFSEIDERNTHRRRR